MHTCTVQLKIVKVVSVLVSGASGYSHLPFTNIPSEGSEGQCRQCGLKNESELYTTHYTQYNTLQFE